MPTAELLKRLENRESLPPIQYYGFNYGFFGAMEEMVEGLENDEDVELEDPTVKARILQAGACPNSSRIYYTLSSVRPKYPTSDDVIENLLDVKSNISRRDAGREFENWVDEGLEALNAWLSSGDLDELEEADIPNSLKEFYLERLELIERLADELEIPLESLQIDIQHEVQAELLGEQTPDGVWLLEDVADYPGAVFESKIAIPYEPGTMRELAGYAVHLERQHEIPIEFGIVQYLELEAGNLNIQSYHIDNGQRDSVRENIQEFASLVSLSKLEPTWGQGEHLKDLIVEPDTPDYSRPCRKCGYEYYCQGNMHIETLTNLSKSIKLGKNRIFSVLEAIKRGQPSRNDVIPEVVDVFGSDKTAKSVFRGMAQPTTEELRLVRNLSDKGTFFLSPNGELVVARGENRSDRLSRCLRDLAVIEYGYYDEAISYFKDYEDDILDEYPKIRYKAKNLIDYYLEPFDVEMPSIFSLEDNPLMGLYRDSDVYKYIEDDTRRRRLLREAFPERQHIQMDNARWNLMEILLGNEYIVSQWFVDELIWAEWATHQPIIDLWEGSTGAVTQLIKNERPYDSLILKGEVS